MNEELLHRLADMTRQRNLLLEAVREECAQFTFPEEDRPELNQALYRVTQMMKNDLPRTEGWWPDQELG